MKLRIGRSDPIPTWHTLWGRYRRIKKVIMDFPETNQRTVLGELRIRRDKKMDFWPYDYYLFNGESSRQGFTDQKQAARFLEKVYQVSDPCGYQEFIEWLEFKSKVELNSLKRKCAEAASKNGGEEHE